MRTKFDQCLFEDFLEEKSFIQLVTNRSEKSYVFWYKYIEDYPEKSEDIELAYNVIKSLKPVNELVSDRKVEAKWMNIEKSIITDHDRYGLKFYLSIAAMVIVFFCGWLDVFQCTLPT